MTVDHNLFTCYQCSENELNKFPTLTPSEQLRKNAKMTEILTARFRFRNECNNLSQDIQTWRGSLIHLKPPLNPSITENSFWLKMDHKYQLRKTCLKILLFIGFQSSSASFIPFIFGLSTMNVFLATIGGGFFVSGLAILLGVRAKIHILLDQHEPITIREVYKYDRGFEDFIKVFVDANLWSQQTEDLLDPELHRLYQRCRSSEDALYQSLYRESWM